MDKVVLLYGGKSGEHEVSLRSAGSVYKHIDMNKYQVILIGVTTEGQWFLQDDAIYKNDNESLVIKESNPVYLSPGKGFITGGSLLKADFVFPLLHGIFGEDGILQGVLETLDIPYGGSDVAGSAIGMDKCLSKHLWQEQGLPVVPFMEVESLDSENINRAADTFGFPLFVKPARAGSSVGVRKTQNPGELIKNLEYAFNFDTKLILEPGIEGREIECSVLGNSNPESFPPGEIVVSDGFYDYSHKYLGSGKSDIVVPAKITRKDSELIQEYAKKAFLTAGAKGYARVDFFLEKKTGNVLINEINTLPGFTSISMFTKLCEAGGITYNQVIDKIITLGKELHSRKTNLKRLPKDISKLIE